MGHSIVFGGYVQCACQETEGSEGGVRCSGEEWGMGSVQLRWNVHSMQDANDVSEGLCNMVYDDVVNCVLWDWCCGGNVGKT